MSRFPNFFRPGVEPLDPNVSSVPRTMVLAQGSQGSKGLLLPVYPRSQLFVRASFVRRWNPLDRMRGMKTRCPTSSRHPIPPIRRYSRSRKGLVSLFLSLLALSLVCRQWELPLKGPVELLDDTSS